MQPVKGLVEDTSRALVLVCHPDDEALIFAPIIISHPGIRVAYCVGNDPERSELFRRSVELLGGEVYDFDDYLEDSQDTYRDDFQQWITRNAKTLTTEFDVIITHNPTTGDMGNHKHHSYLGRALKTLEIATRIYCVAEHGLASHLCVLSLQEYTNLQHIWFSIYGSYCSYLNPSKYPLRSYIALQQIQDAEVRPYGQIAPSVVWQEDADTVALFKEGKLKDAVARFWEDSSGRKSHFKGLSIWDVYATCVLQENVRWPKQNVHKVFNRICANPLRVRASPLTHRVNALPSPTRENTVLALSGLVDKECRDWLQKCGWKPVEFINHAYTLSNPLAATVSLELAVSYFIFGE